MSLRKAAVAAAVFGLAALAGLAPDAAHGCTVCYGESESAIILGAQQATFLMVGITYLLLGGGVVTFVVLRRRAGRRAPRVEEEGALQ